MNRENERERNYVIGIIIALIVIGIGSVMVWNSFKSFDESFIRDKDAQLGKLIQAQDSNIEISLISFAREADAWFSRQSSIHANKEWTQINNTAQLKRLLDSFTSVENDIYAGRAIYQDHKLIPELSTEHELLFVTQPDENNYAICHNDENIYYLAYCISMPESMEYCILIDLKNLVNNATVAEQTAEDMTFMLDEDCTVVIYKYGDIIDVISADEDVDGINNTCCKFILDCQTADNSSAKSIEVENDEEKYTARMMVSCSDDTNNGIFAIGMTTNYDATLKPSRRAASRILIFGGIAVLGVMLLLIILVLMRRTSNIELENLRKKNETLKEINREIQELAHHQRLETIGTMTAGIAHDFNNLLTPIMGYSMMTMEMLPEDARDLQENLLEVYNASLKAKDIVSQLAELTKHGDKATFDNIVIDDVIQNSLKVTFPVKPESVEIELDLNCGSNTIRGNRTQISQLVMNLTLNAYDAMGGRGGKYRIETTCEGDNVVLRFRDEGVGMDPETVAKIFDPFFKTKGAGKGPGLGLAIVAHIVETHGAKVYVESEPGIGTEFTIVFAEKETV